MGQGNRILWGEQLPEVAVVPSGPFAPGGKTAPGLPVPAQQIEGHAPSRERP